MNQNEYKILKFNHSKEEEERIKQFNEEHLRKSLELLKYNRDRLINDNEYFKLSIIDRNKEIAKLDEFKDYCKLYPVVSKFIISHGLFSSKAFLKYLDWKSSVRPHDSTRERLINNQREQEKFKNKYMYAVYVKYLYSEKSKETGQHLSLDQINQVYLETVKALNDETDEFFDIYEKTVNENKEKEKEYNKERKKRIVEQLKMKLENK